jgi:hypothetical protein
LVEGFILAEEVMILVNLETLVMLLETVVVEILERIPKVTTQKRMIIVDE